MELKAKVTKRSLMYMLSLMGLCVWYFALLSTDLSDQYNTAVGILSIVCAVWAGITLKMINGIWFSLPFVFELSFLTFTLGQSILTGFGIDPGNMNLYLRENNVDVNSAYLFTILCFISLHTGIVLKLSRSGRTSKEDDKSFDYKPLMKIIGWIVFALSFVPFAIEFYRLTVAYSTLGYRGAFDSLSGTTSWSKMFSYIADYYPMSLFMLLVAYRDKRRVYTSISGLIILLSFANFAIGNRSEPVCYIVALLWVYRKNARSRSARRRTSMIAVIIVFFLILIVPIIGQTRNTGELTLRTVYNGVFGEGSAFDTFVSSVSSLGYSAFPTIKTMQLIPESFPYHFGQSYFFATLSIFPNLFGGTHISVQYAALAQWLMKALNMGTGPGYSMPAEAYYNFGLFGALVMLILGYLIALLIDERDTDSKPLRTFIVIASFVVLFSIPRRDTLTALRNMVYYVGLLVLIVKLSARRIRKIGSRQSGVYNR